MIDKFINELKTTLSLQARRDLDKIVKLPEVAAIIARDDAAEVEQRRKKLAELAGLPAKRAKEFARLLKQLSADEKRVAELEESLRQAREALTLTRAHISGIEVNQNNEEGAIRRWLSDGADRRLKELRAHVMFVFDAVQSSTISYTVGFEAKPFNEGTMQIVSSNAQVCTKACADLREIRHEIEAELFAASTRAEITAKLLAWHARIVEAVRPVGLRRVVLQISEHGELSPMTIDAWRAVRTFREEQHQDGQEVAYQQSFTAGLS